MSQLYRPGGSIDKIVQVRLSDLYLLIESVLRNQHNYGSITVPDVRNVATEIVGAVEVKSKTIAIISL